MRRFINQVGLVILFEMGVDKRTSQRATGGGAYMAMRSMRTWFACTRPAKPSAT
jgi:hypothetical protein